MTNPAPAPDAGLTITERDMLGALELLATADADPDVATVLTDEELLALDGLEGLRVLGSPYIDQRGVDLETASATAIRGLIARRVVNPTHEARDDEGAVLVGGGDPQDRLLQLDRGLAGLLTLRRIPEGMVIVERLSSGLRTTLGLYFFPDGGVLEEFVATDGFHHFCVPTRDVVAGRLADFVDPHGTAAEDGEVEEIGVGEIDALSGLEDTRLIATVASMGADEGRRATVLAMSDRVRVVDNGTADPGSLGADDVLAISDVSAQTLRAILEELLPRIPDDAEGVGTAG